MTRTIGFSKYKETGLKWLGRVPFSWGVVPLWTLYTRGKSTNFPDEELLSVYRDHGVVPKSSRGDNFNKPSDDLTPYQLVKPGDMVINKMKAWQGSVAISRHRGIVSPAYFVYERHHSMDDRYLHYLLRSERYIAGYLSLSKGIRINQWDLDPTYHSRMPVLVPSIQEQRCIVEFLDRETAQIDDLINKQERLIELLAEKRQAIITHAVTKGLDSSAPTKPSGIPWLGEIPVHWTDSRLKFVVIRIEQGVSPQAAGVPASSDTWGVLKSGCVNGGVFRESENKQLPDGFIIDSKIVVRVGDLLVSRASGSPKLVGSAARVRSLLSKLILSDKTFRFVPKSEIDPDFLEWFLNCQPYREQVIGSISGAEGLANNISTSALKNIRIPLPPISEQSRIAVELRRKTDGLSALETKSRKAIHLLRERRSALISAAVTGKIAIESQGITS